MLDGRVFEVGMVDSGIIEVGIFDVGIFIGKLKMRIPSHSVSKLARSFFIAHFVDLQNSLHDDEIFFHRLVHI